MDALRSRSINPFGSGFNAKAFYATPSANTTADYADSHRLFKKDNRMRSIPFSSIP
jgi:hypothetical protein